MPLPTFVPLLPAAPLWFLARQARKVPPVRRRGAAYGRAMSTTENTRSRLRPGVIVLLVVAPDAVTVLMFVPLALAGLLWFLSR